MIPIHRMLKGKGKCEAKDPSNCRFHHTGRFSSSQEEIGHYFTGKLPSWIDDEIIPIERWEEYHKAIAPSIIRIASIPKGTRGRRAIVAAEELKIIEKSGILFGLGEKQCSVVRSPKQDRFWGNKDAEVIVDKVVDFYERLCPKSVMPTDPVVFCYAPKYGGSEYSQGIAFFNKPMFIDVAHEFAHYIEENNEYIGMACEAYLDMRCEGEPTVLIGYDWRGNPIYGRKDKFANPYSGRDYFIIGKQQDGNVGRVRIMTEILSTGVEELFYNPIRQYLEDKDLFAFTYNTLKGEMV